MARTHAAGRVIAGAARGIRLTAPGSVTRPLADRVKQALFAILEPKLRGRAVLDLYAGSGAGGIEALSRGASSVVFVERDRDAVAAIVRNLAATGLAGGRAEVVRSEVVTYLHRAASAAPPAPAPPAYGVVLVDPPYDRPDELEAALEAVAGAGPGVILAADGLLVAKHFWKTPPAGPRLLRSTRQERFGETMLTFYRWAEEDG
jgi:16S rRNA (guanine966-N2)-methyltransferase